METISMKLEKEMLQKIDGSLKKHNYGTRTEFMRAALREKLDADSREETIRQFLSLRPKSKTLANDAEDRRIREEIGRQYAKKFGVKLD